MRIAIQGCGHGNLNSIYNHLARLAPNYNVDLLIICGDFQAVRNQADLHSMAVPPKYRMPGDFPEYWRGEKKAPVLTIFVGGNHEASRHLEELPFGGWVAPNFYYLGRSGVIRVDSKRTGTGIRIGGISGLYHHSDYQTGYYEQPPYEGDALRSVYHTREFDIFKLSLLKEPLDIMISHEWPHGIYTFGDEATLLKKKPFLARDIHNGGIGAPPLCHLLNQLRPRWWFAAHMHVEFEAQVFHENKDRGESTRFLALDKCLPGRRHMRIIEIGKPSQQEEEKVGNDALGQDSGDKQPSSTPKTITLSYDPEWLSIIRAINPYLSFTRRPPPRLPTLEELRLEDHRLWINKHVQGRDWFISEKYNPPSSLPGYHTTFLQTRDFCKLLSMKDHWNDPPQNK